MTTKEGNQVMSAKEAAGRRAADMVATGTIVGLGTGSTVWFTLVRLAERIQSEGLEIVGVPTSRDTTDKATELGIPLVGLGEVEAIDFTIDGADEIDGEFQMIKGGGGALLREKVIASITKREAIIVGADKVVDKLGTTFLLPVEVASFALPTVSRAIAALGCEPVLRLSDPGVALTTDNGNQILDCRFPDGIDDARALETQLATIPGVVESGLFIDLAHVLIIGKEDGTTEIRIRE
jgi:ribose 5-phosphate isomerase A